LPKRNIVCVDRDILEKFMNLCVKDFYEARESGNRVNIDANNYRKN